MFSLLDLPLELRLQIYEAYMTLHQSVRHGQQPSNEHVHVLRTCKHIYYEASPIFCRYISLSLERQIRAFVSSPGVIQPSQVLWADVANDGRFLHTGKDESYPLSHLYLALRMLSSLQRVRVFDCRQGLPITLESLRSKRISLQFEETMFVAYGHQPPLLSYELFVSPHTRSNPFSMVSPKYIRRLRLSGDCHISAEVKGMPHLRHLTLFGITSNIFDRNNLEQRCHGADLVEFCYGVGAKDGFLIRDHHIRSIAFGAGRNLRKLVLLGCSRLTSSTLAECIGALYYLTYLAISIITVEELETNFLLFLPRTVSILKLDIANAAFTRPFIDQERNICNTLENDVFTRVPALQLIAVNVRSQLIDVEGRRRRWTSFCQERWTQLYIGNWIKDEYV